MDSLKVRKGSSQTINVETISEEHLLGAIPPDLFEGYVYAVFVDEICLGRYKNSLLHFNDRNIEDTLHYLQELRVFTKESEFRAMRVGQEFRCRHRIESEIGDESYYIEETQKIWGSSITDKHEWSHLREARGASLWVPFKLKKGEKLGLRVRQYLQFDEKSYQYEDERFVDLEKWEEE